MFPWRLQHKFVLWRSLHLKKPYTKPKEGQSNQRLPKTLLRDMLSFGLNQIINKPTWPTFKTSSLLDHILTNLKESVTQHGVIILGLSDHDFISCTRKIKCFKSRKHNTISVRTYKNYSKKLIEERLTQIKFQTICYFHELIQLQKNTNNPKELWKALKNLGVQRK